MTVILKWHGFERVETIESTVPPKTIVKKLNGWLVTFQLQTHSKHSDIAVYSA